jgi:hypothetical protein
VSTVTYRGPVNPLDGSSVYVLPTEDGELSFRRDVPTEDVPQEVASELRKAEGHRFDFGKAAEGPVEPYDGFDDATVEEIEERLGDSHDPDLAARVIAYERENKGRKGVLEAAGEVEEPEVFQGP